MNANQVMQAINHIQQSYEPDPESKLADRWDVSRTDKELLEIIVALIARIDSLERVIRAWGEVHV